MLFEQGYDTPSQITDYNMIYIIVINNDCRFSMLFEHGYEPPSKKPCPGSGSGETSLASPGPLDCSKSENNGADMRIRQVSSDSYQTSLTL